jgi:hypothetical protein
VTTQASIAMSKSSKPRRSRKRALGECTPHHGVPTLRPPNRTLSSAPTAIRVLDRCSTTELPPHDVEEDGIRTRDTRFGTTGRKLCHPVGWSPEGCAPQTDLWLYTLVGSAHGAWYSPRDSNPAHWIKSPALYLMS